MISNEKEYKMAVRNMIKRVQNAKNIEELNRIDMPAEDREILFDCISEGFIRGKTHDYLGKNREFRELRMQDGSARPEVYSTVITLKGLAFLKPDHTKARANIALAMSVAAFLVSILSNLDKITQNLQLLSNLVG